MISGLPQLDRNRLGVFLRFGLHVVLFLGSSPVYVGGLGPSEQGVCVFVGERLVCECLMSFCVSPYVCTVVCVVGVIHCEVLCTLPPCSGGVFVQTAPMFAQGCHDDWAGWLRHCSSGTQDRPKCS